MVRQPHLAAPWRLDYKWVPRVAAEIMEQVPNYSKRYTIIKDWLLMFVCSLGMLEWVVNSILRLLEGWISSTIFALQLRLWNIQLSISSIEILRSLFSSFFFAIHASLQEDPSVRPSVCPSVVMRCGPRRNWIILSRTIVLQGWVLSVICRLSSVVCRLLSVVCRL